VQSRNFPCGPVRYRLLQPGSPAAPARLCALPSVSNSQLARRGGRRDKLFCALTCHIVNKQAASIEKHIRGKKYCKAKGAPRACLRLLPARSALLSLRPHAWAGPQSCWSGASTRCWRSRTSRAARCAARAVGPCCGAGGLAATGEQRAARVAPDGHGAGPPGGRQPRGHRCAVRRRR